MPRILIVVALTSLPMLAQPSIKTGGVVNVSGYQQTLAPGVVFVIFGANIGPASIVTASAPYPTTLGGTSISFTPSAGGAPIAATMVYSLAGQVAGVLPSSTSPGTYLVRVTYNSQPSAPATVTVVPRSFGIATSNSAGTSTAQATIANVNGGISLTRFTSGSTAFGGFNWTLTPAHPGDTLVLWGTGGGADLANDTGGTSGDQTAAGNFVVNVGGTPITPLYAGAASGYPGLWQINFTLPATITPDCFAFTQVSAGGQLSNAVTIPIAAAGQTSCSSPGFTQSTLNNLQNGGAITFAGMTVGRTTFTSATAAPSITETLGGPFSKFNPSEWLLLFSGPKIGPCNVLDESYPTGSKEPSGADAYLDPGAKLTLSGPNLLAGSGATAVTTPTGPIDIGNFPSGTLVNGGTYTITGTGGTQVGPFTATATLPSSFAVTNWSSLTSIDRSQPLTVSWTGSGFDQVILRAQSALVTTATTHNVTLTCTVPAAPGTYSIPAAALAYLLPTATASNIGQFSVTTSVNDGGYITGESSSSTSLTPPLVGGGQVDFGAFAAFLTMVQSVKVQ